MPPINNVWANSTPASIGEDITLPSGQVCRARRLGIEDLVSAGIIEQADSLTSLVDAKHVRKVRGGKGADREEIVPASVLSDPTALRSMLTVADRSLPMIVMEPTVKLHYVVGEDGVQRMLTADEREQGVVYTDQIGLADKLELFAWAMGELEGLQSFRGAQPGTHVGAVATRNKPARAAKRTPRASGK